MKDKDNLTDLEAKQAEGAEHPEAEQLSEDEEARYKELYEKLEVELDEKQAEFIDEKRQMLLKKAGYNANQVQRFKKYLTGTNEAELKEEIEQLKMDFPPKKQYADPGTGNGHRKKAKATNLEQKGRSLYKRLKDLGKIRK